MTTLHDAIQLDLDGSPDAVPTDPGAPTRELAPHREDEADYGYELVFDEPTGHGHAAVRAVPDGIEAAMDTLRETRGYLACGVVDALRRTRFGFHAKGDMPIEAACMYMAETIRLQRAGIESLAIDDHVHDICFTLGTQYHLVHPLPGHEGVFYYLVLERRLANLALARRMLTSVCEAHHAP